MSAHLHYDGRRLDLRDGAEGARQILKDIRASAAGGIVEAKTTGGTITFVVGPGIPVAVWTEGE